MKKNTKMSDLKQKNKKRLIIIAIIAIIIIGIIIISKTISNNNENKNNENQSIQYTDELNFTTYVDENGYYVTEYDNGDKTIETRR